MSVRDSHKRVLDVLHEEGRMTPSLVADRLDLSPNYVRQLMTNIRDVGYIQPVEPESISSGLYELTARGRSVVEDENREAQPA